MQLRQPEPIDRGPVGATNGGVNLALKAVNEPLRKSA